MRGTRRKGGQAGTVMGGTEMTDIRIRRLTGTWVVRAGGAVLGETTRALGLSDGRAPEVVYFPREDLAMAMLEPSATVRPSQTKGAARYFAIQTKSTVIEDAGWSYEEPMAEVEAIGAYVAFDTDKVTVEAL